MTISLFRSEEHVDRWLERTGMARGAVLPAETVVSLAKLWYPDPRDPAWRPRTRDESQRLLASLGLTEAFWDLG